MALWKLDNESKNQAKDQEVLENDVKALFGRFFAQLKTFFEFKANNPNPFFEGVSKTKLKANSADKGST